MLCIVRQEGEGELLEGALRTALSEHTIEAAGKRADGQLCGEQLGASGSQFDKRLSHCSGVEGISQSGRVNAQVDGLPLVKVHRSGFHDHIYHTAAEYGAEPAFPAGNEQIVVVLWHMEHRKPQPGAFFQLFHSQSDIHLGTELPLAHAHKGGRGAVIQGGTGAPQRQAIVYSVIFQIRITQICPAKIQFRPRKVVFPGLFLIFFLIVGWSGNLHGIRNQLSAIDYRPTILVPFHGSDHGFPACVMQHKLGGPDTMEYNPPLSVLVLNQIGVAQGLGKIRTGVNIPVGKNGVVGAAFEGTPGRVAAGDGLHVAVLSAAFGNHQVILAVDFIHVGALRTFSAGTVPDGAGFSKHRTGFQIHYALANALTFFVSKSALKVNGSIIVPKKGGVDAALFDIDGIGPGAVDVVGAHEKVTASADIGGDHVKSPVVAAKSWGKNAARGRTALQAVLTGTCEYMAYLLPVKQVSAVPQGYARKKLKGTKCGEEAIRAAEYRLILTNYPERQEIVLSS